MAELKAKLAILEPQIAAIEVQIAQLKRSVWVTKEEIMAGDFHFQGKRYQPAVDEPVYQESPLILLRQAQLIQQLIDRGMQRLWNELTHLYEPTVKIAPGGLVDEAK